MSSPLLDHFSKTKPGDVGIIGHPVDHSLSPAMHNAAFRHLRLTVHYHKFPVTPEELDQIPGLLRRFSLKGVNVTVPHKSTALSFVEDRDLAPFARLVGGLNMLTVDGKTLKGDNTDGIGFERALRETGFEASGKSVVVLGAGGATGKLVIHKLLELGIKESDLILWNRTHRDGIEIQRGDNPPLRLRLSPLKEVQKKMTEADLIVNATAVGLKDGDGLPMAGLNFRKGQYAFDVIYHRETAFMKDAKSAGARVAGGLSMLLHQGAEAFRIWTGAEAPISIMKEALTNALKERGMTPLWP